MNSADELVTGTDGWPTFDLAYRYDERADPTTVTVYDATAADVTTAWISASVEDAVSLDRLD